MTYKKTGRATELALTPRPTPQKKPTAARPTPNLQSVQDVETAGILAGGRTAGQSGTPSQDVLGFLPMPKTETDTARSSDRLNLRVSPAVKGLLERGAALKGLTLTDYITAAMVETARQDIARSMRRRLSARDTARLLEMIREEGQEPTERMREAAGRYNEMVSGAVR